MTIFLAGRKRVLNMFEWLKKNKKNEHSWKIRDFRIKWFPSSRSCVKQDMSHVRPQQMPPLMVRKAAWRR
jgi:hypothetical protein